MHSKPDRNRPENPGDDRVMSQTRAALVDLLIKIRRGEAGYDLAAKFLDKTTGAPPPSGG
jgi:hypothetical protein